MGKIQVVAVNVEGDAAVITEALKMAMNILNRNNGNADPVPVPGPGPDGIVEGAPVGAPAPTRSAGRNYPRQCACGVILENRWQAGGHGHSCSAKSQMISSASGTAPSEHKEFFCPMKNCGKSFKKKGWRDGHLKRDHEIEEPV